MLKSKSYLNKLRLTKQQILNEGKYHCVSNQAD